MHRAIAKGWLLAGVMMLWGTHALADDPCSDSGACDAVEQPEDASDRRAADALVRQAELSPKRARSFYKRAADAYMELWSQRGSAACVDSRSACDERFGEDLWNAGKAYAAAGLRGSSIHSFEVLTDPKFSFHKTELSRRACFEIASGYLSIAMFDLAASWYERFVEEAPKDEQSPLALEEAVVLRFGLGQNEQAVANANRFQRYYGRKQQTILIRIGLLVAEQLLRAGDIGGAEKMGGPNIREAREADLDMQIRAQVLYARSLRLQGDSRSVDAYRAATNAWRAQRSSQAIARLDAQGGSAPVELRRLGRVLTDVGEALFYEAELARSQADAIAPPAFDAALHVAEATFIQGPVAAWIAQRSAAIQLAEGRYLEIVQLTPAPPPKWLVPAHAAVASMWDQFGKDLDQAGYPASLATALSHERSRLRARATSDYRRCVDTSTKVQAPEPAAARCHAWLSQHDASRHPRIDELAPHLMRALPIVRSAPLEGSALEGPE